jgi:hypothetical protein
MQMYARDVAQRFASKCVNESLGNKMGVSNSLEMAIEKKYASIVWEESEEQVVESENPSKQTNEQ